MSATELHPRTPTVIEASESYKLRATLALCRDPRPGDPRPLEQIAALIEGELEQRATNG